MGPRPELPLLALAGDVGGTNTRLALYEVEGPRLRAVTARTEASGGSADLPSIVRRFVADSGRTPRAACLGVAGPVRDGKVHATNLPWVVDSRELAATLGLPEAWLLNDLEATAYGIDALGPDDAAILQAGESEPQGHRAVIAAGTGLGEAGMVWDGQAYRPVATEGGHADFAPVDDLQVELWRFLRAEFGRVSVERVLSGPGLVNIYRFLRDTGRGHEPPTLAAEVAGDHAPAAISRAALEGQVPLARQALELMVAIYGAEAGNLALRMLATGGLWVAGGIAPKLLPLLREPAFLTAFRAKGRLAPMMARVSVRVVQRDDTALLGAARAAALRIGVL